MKELVLLIICFTVGEVCNGQGKKIYVTTYKNGEKSISYQQQQEEFQKAGLQNLTKSTDTLHFRFSSAYTSLFSLNLKG
jgi:hypothetical protein